MNVTFHQPNEIMSEMYDSDPFVEAVPFSQDILMDLGHDPDDYSVTYDLRINNEMLEFIQKEGVRFGEARRLPYYFWKLRYLNTGVIENGTNEILLDFNPRGDLIVLSDSLVLSPQVGSGITNDEAEGIAKSFLGKYTAIDTSGFLVLESSANLGTGYSEFTFEFSQSSFSSTQYSESLSISVTSDKVTNYSRNINLIEIDESGFVFILDFVIEILRTVIYLAGIILVIVVLIKKFKRDELEYRKGMWLGAITGVLFAVNIGLIEIVEDRSRLEIVLASFFGGMLM